MRSMFAGLAVVVVSGVGTAPVSAQARSLERAFDRVGDRVEWAMDRLAAAFDGDGADAPLRQEARDFHWSGPMPNGGALEIKGVNGAIVAERAPGRDVVVTATLRGRRSDPATVQVEVVEHAGGLTFCAVYPTPAGERENVCASGSDGRMNTRRNDVEVDFRVQVPEGVPFVGRTVNGDLEGLALASDVDLVTVNGDVDVTTSGFARAETVNGSIDAVMGSGPGDQAASFRTVNGSITLDVPDDLDAELDASWLNGDMESDLPLTLSGRLGRRSARGTLGRGGPVLELSTVNGSIRIR